MFVANDNSKKTDRKDTRSRRSFICAIVGSALGIFSSSLCAGCKALNEDPRNDRVWYPTLAPPSKEEQLARERNFPEGGDPFVDAETGPRSLNTRPKGWDIQRSKTYYDSAD